MAEYKYADELMTRFYDKMEDSILKEIDLADRRSSAKTEVESYINYLEEELASLKERKQYFLDAMDKREADRQKELNARVSMQRKRDQDVSKRIMAMDGMEERLALNNEAYGKEKSYNRLTSLEKATITYFSTDHRGWYYAELDSPEFGKHYIDTDYGFDDFKQQIHYFAYDGWKLGKEF